jgi:hypothetical protein
VTPITAENKKFIEACKVYDFEEAKRIEEAEEYGVKAYIAARFDGYIAPDGAYYGTKPTGIDYHMGSANLHEDFAEMYVTKIMHAKPTHLASYKDCLVEKHGWISCTWELFVLPGPQISGPDRSRITKAQKETLFRLFQIRGEDMKRYFEFTGEGEE